MSKLCGRWVWGASALLLLCAACGSGGDTAVAGTGTVQGVVVDPAGDPVPAINVGLIGYGGGARTSDDGSFVMVVPQGTQQLVVHNLGVTVASRAFQIVEFERVDLGVIGVVEGADSDGDKLADELEAIGWDIFVNLTGTSRKSKRRVYSNPAVMDTDDDQLDDGQEFAAKTDPQLDDTDGDLLSDFDELNRYKSNPAHVDTDGDACPPGGCSFPNPSLFDGNELLFSGTSPTLADTDGDGLSDYEEIIGGGLNPLVAELPQIELEVNGDPQVNLNLKQGTTITDATTSYTLTRDQQERERNDARSTRIAIENKQSIETKVKAGGPPLSGSAEVTARAEFSQAFARETSMSLTQTAINETQNSYQTDAEKGIDTEVENGTISVAFKVNNSSSRGLAVEDLSVIAYRWNPDSQSGFSVVALLTPDTAFPDNVVLGPSGTFSFVAQNDAINFTNIQPLLARPGSLFFEVANYTLFQVDDKGENVRDFAALGERILERCGLVVIDYGNGQVDRHLIATNVRRSPDGDGLGLTLREALEIIGKTQANGDVGLTEFQVEGAPTGRMILTDLKDAQGGSHPSFGILPDYENPGFKPDGDDGYAYWLLAASNRAAEYEEDPAITDPGTGDPVPLPKDFDDIVLESGERINLVYISDRDGDGLYDREEELLGTDPDNADTDRDDLTDGFEVKEGWRVIFLDEDGNDLPGDPSEYSYQVFSNPRSKDSDGDDLTDDQERTLTANTNGDVRGTDPNRRDTDGDGKSDFSDLEPLGAPAGDVAPNPEVGLIARWRFDRATSTYPSAGYVDGTKDPSLTGPDPDLTVQGDDHLEQFTPDRTGGSGGIFDFYDRYSLVRRACALSPGTNLDPDKQGYGWFSGPNLADEGFTQEFSLTMWVFPLNDAQGSRGSDVFLFGQDEWAAFKIDQTKTNGAEIRFEMPSPVGSSTLVVTDPNLAPDEAWTFYAVTVTFDVGANETKIRLYRNAGEDPVDETSVGSPIVNPSNSDTDGGMRIGASRGLRYPDPPEMQDHYSGAIDDFRVYSRPITVREIEAIYNAEAE